MNTFRGEIVHASGRLGRSTNNSSSSIPNRADVKQHKDNESDESEGKTAFKTKLFKLPVAFKYLGFSLLLTYHYVLWFIPESFRDTNLLSSTITNAWLYNLLGTCCSMVAIALVLRRSKHLLTHKVLFYLIPVVLIALSLFMQYNADSFDMHIAFYVISAIAGIAEGFMWVLWGECLVCSKAKFSVMHIGAMFGATLFIGMVVALVLPDVLVPIFTSSLLALSAILLFLQTSQLKQGFITLLPRKTVRGAYKTVITVSGIAFITSMACYFLVAIIPWQELPFEIDAFSLGITAGALLIFMISIIAFLQKTKMSIFNVFPYFLVLTIASYCLFLYSNSLQLPPFITVLCVFSVLEIFLIMYFGILMQRGIFASATVFAFSVVSVRLGVYIGNSIAVYYEHFPHLGSQLTPLTSYIFIIVLAIVLVSIAKRENDIVQLTTAPTTQSETDTICKEIAAEFNLTERETEILKLMANNDPTSLIADKLFISPYTVNTHIRNIYKKVGIHKRSELTGYIHMRKTYD